MRSCADGLRTCASLCIALPLHCTVAIVQELSLPVAPVAKTRPLHACTILYIVPLTAMKTQSNAEKTCARKLGICTPFLASWRQSE
ncbi:hypothetical protein DFH11DRAFT_1632095 [Phellopilus nigrolimitatus]|nr:hypothetical protein DFH11DRAFT_1632095 [Phellopilus nigrolimitatus]